LLGFCGSQSLTTPVRHARIKNINNRLEKRTKNTKNAKNSLGSKDQTKANKQISAIKSAITAIKIEILLSHFFLIKSRLPFRID
jgi:transposase-like protein